jgi:hypothetical protein
MRKGIKEVLMERDGISETEAEQLIQEAQEALEDGLFSGDMDSAENICEEYFGLEPDFLDDLI